MLDTQIQTTSKPATELAKGDVIRWRYLYKDRDTRLLVDRVWVSKTGTIWTELADADIEDAVDREKTRQSWCYDDTDEVTVEVTP